MSTDIENFENSRWRGMQQPLCFRHITALKIVNKKRILDFGCGDGLLLEELLKNSKMDNCGVDLSQEAVNICLAKGLHVNKIQGAGDKLPFKDGEFDYVVFLDVLEHLYEPQMVFSEAKRVAKEGAVISVPNFSSLPARLQMLFGKIPENNHCKKGHVFWFNYNILLDLVAQEGMFVEECWSNTIWENNKIFGPIFKKIFLKLFPNLFALSFVVKIKKK